MVLDNITVFINGEPLIGSKTFQGEITQEIGEHHFFKISFSLYNDRDATGVPFADHDKYQNQEISIFSNNGEFSFKGIILGVHHIKKSGTNGLLVLTGASPTFLMQRTTQCQSFDEQSTIQDIITEVTQVYPANILKTFYGNEASTQLGYTVQYNESDWDFVTRLSKRYGIFTYYDGETLNIGRNTNNVKHWTCNFEREVPEFEVIDEVNENSFTLNIHDWTSNEPHTADAKQVNTQIPQGASETFNRSGEAFTKTGAYHYPHLQDDLNTQQLLDYMTKVQAQGKIASMIKAKGKTELLGLKLCDHIEVKGYEFINLLSDQPYGTYEITKIKHTFTNTGVYYNEIEAITTGLDHPHIAISWQFQK